MLTVTKTRRPRREAVGVGGDFVQFFEGEVLGLGPGGELLQAQVDGIGPVVEGGEGRLGAAGRGQQLDLTGRRLARDRGGG